MHTGICLLIYVFDVCKQPCSMLGVIDEPLNLSSISLEHQLVPCCLGDCPRVHTALKSLAHSSKVLTHLFRERSFSKVFHRINTDEISYCEHLVDYHCTSCTRERLNELLYSESNSESELTFQSFHLIVSCHTGKKLEVDLTQDGLSQNSQLQDLGLNCLPPLPQYRVTAFVTQCSNKA